MWTVWVLGSLGIWWRYSWHLHKAKADQTAAYLRTKCGEIVKVEKTQ